VFVLARSEVEYRRRRAARHVAAVSGHVPGFAKHSSTICARASRSAVRDVLLLYLDSVCLAVALSGCAAQYLVCRITPCVINGGILLFLLVIACAVGAHLLLVSTWLGAPGRGLTAMWVWVMPGLLMLMFMASFPTIGEVAQHATRAQLLFRDRTGSGTWLIGFSAVMADALVLFHRSVAKSRWLPVQSSPLDRTFLSLLDNAGEVAVQLHRQRWTDPNNVANLRSWIRLTARTAEGAYMARAGWFLDHRSRRNAQRAGLRLAEAIRAHIDPITTAADERPYTRVLVSLADGVEHWVLDDLDAMLEGLPEPAHPGRLKMLRRMAPSAVLAAAAILVPLIPQVAAVSGAPSGIRLTLASAAILSLLGSIISPADQILGILGKITSFGGKN
jgi:hypothetical protein